MQSTLQSTPRWQVLKMLSRQEQSQTILSKPLRASAEPTSFSVGATTKVSRRKIRQFNKASSQMETQSDFFLTEPVESCEGNCRYYKSC